MREHIATNEIAVAEASCSIADDATPGEPMRYSAAVYTVTLILLVLVIAIGFAIKVPVMAIFLEAFGYLKNGRGRTRGGRE